MKVMSTSLIEKTSSLRSRSSFACITALHYLELEELGIISPSQTLKGVDRSVRKSQIAIEYAYRFRQSRLQSHVFWVYAASSGTFLQACHDIARSLKLPACDDSKTDPCELVSKWLKEGE